METPDIFLDENLSGIKKHVVEFYQQRLILHSSLVDMFFSSYIFHGLVS